MGKFNRYHKHSYKPKSSGDEQPQVQFQLGVERRRVTVRKFRSMKLVDIREYYQKNDEWLPGTKGISLTEDQWSALVSKIDDINDALHEIDHKDGDSDNDNEDDEDSESSESSSSSESEDLEGVEFEDVADARRPKRQKRSGYKKRGYRSKKRKRGE